jgi:hypothetical protein
VGHVARGIIISCDYIDFDYIRIDVLRKEGVRISIQASEAGSGGRWPRTGVALSFRDPLGVGMVVLRRGWMLLWR